MTRRSFPTLILKYRIDTRGMADTWPYPLTFKEQAHYPIIQEPTSPWYLLEVPNEPFLEINSAQNLHWPLGGEGTPPLPPLPSTLPHFTILINKCRCRGSSRLPYSRDDSLEFCKRTPDGGINKIGPGVAAIRAIPATCTLGSERKERRRTSTPRYFQQVGGLHTATAVQRSRRGPTLDFDAWTPRTTWDAEKCRPVYWNSLCVTARG